MGWRYIAWNSEANQLFGLDKAKEIKIREIVKSRSQVPKEDELTVYPQLIEMILNPEYKMHQLVFSAPPALAEDFAAQQLNNFFGQTEDWSKLPWCRAIRTKIRMLPNYARINSLRDKHGFTPNWLSYGHTELPFQSGGQEKLVEFASELNTDRRFEVLRYIPLPKTS